MKIFCEGWGKGRGKDALLHPKFMQRNLCKQLQKFALPHVLKNRRIPELAEVYGGVRGAEFIPQRRQGWA
jgi:hypothetical protein